MGKAIAVLSVIVVCCFAFVAQQLAARRPRVRPTAAAAPLLRARDDGSLYAVDVDLGRLERRVVDEEKRSLKLQEELATLRDEREQLKTQVAALEEDLRRLRRTVNGRIAAPGPRPDQPPPGNAPGNAPGVPGNVPDGSVPPGNGPALPVPPPG